MTAVVCGRLSNISFRDCFFIIIDEIKGKKSKTEICKTYNISDEQFDKLKDIFISGGKKVLEKTLNTSSKKT